MGWDVNRFEFISSSLRVLAFPHATTHVGSSATRRTEEVQQAIRYSSVIPRKSLGEEPRSEKAQLRYEGGCGPKDLHFQGTVSGNPE